MRGRRIATLWVDDWLSSCERGGDTEHLAGHFPLNRHVVGPSAVGESVALHMIGLTCDHRGDDGAQVIGIHLSITSHHHADKWTVKLLQHGLMASVNRCPNALSVEVDFDQFGLTLSRFDLLRCRVGRAVIDHHNAIHTLRHCLNDFANKLRFILGRNNDADVPSFLHEDSSLPQVMNLTSLPIEHRHARKTVQVTVCLRGFIGRRHGLQSVADIPLRIVLVGRDIELRIVSLIVRAREVADEVVFLDLGSNDTTVELAQEVGCTSLHFTESLNPKQIALFLRDCSLDPANTTLAIHVTDAWKLQDISLSINRARELWDIHLSHIEDGEVEESDEDPVLSTLELRHLVMTESGMAALAQLDSNGTQQSLDQKLRVRIVKASANVNIHQRESLATASKFAQLFYWMLESKHPLLLFGIPGIVLFFLGYRLSGNIVGALEEINSTSIGVTLATIAMTLIGLFSIMVALILYIMGKQVEQIQSQYDWPSRS